MLCERHGWGDQFLFEDAKFKDCGKRETMKRGKLLGMKRDRDGTLIGCEEDHH